MTACDPSWKNQMTRATHVMLATTCIMLVGLSGCRNRCGSCLPANPFTASSRIAAPPTYSMRAPNLAQPYYGNTADASLGIGIPAPNPANATLPGNTGWQNSGTPGSLNSTSFNVPPGQNPFVPGFSVVGSTLANSNNSQLVSRPYSSTQFDPRMDATRVPMTDATRVAAPTMISPQQAYGGLAQAGYQTPAFPGNNGQPVLGRSAATNRGEVYGQVRSATPYAGYVAQLQPNTGANPQNPNLNLQNNPNIQNGWTASQTASQPQPNRQ